MSPKKIKALRPESNFPKNPSCEPNWDNHREIAQYLRGNGFPDVPLRWGDIDPMADRLDRPDHDGLVIVASGTDTGLDEERKAQVKRRLDFAHKYSGRRTGIRSDRGFTEGNLITAAQRLGIAPYWFLNGSTVVNLDETEVDGVSESESIAHVPEFMRHYEMLSDAADYATQLAHWFEHPPANGVQLDEHAAVVRDACLAVVRYKQGMQNSCSYKLDYKGELALKRSEERVRYFPFIADLLPLKTGQDANFYLGQRYDLQITGEERTALLHGLGMLGEYLGAMNGTAPYSLDRFKGDSQYGKRLFDLHAKLSALMGKDKASPFQRTARKGSGRKRK